MKMKKYSGSRAGVTMLVLAATLTPAVGRALPGCLTNPVVKINGVPVNGSVNLLGSPSGLAGNNGGLTFEVSPAEFAELWVASDYACCRPPVNLFPNANTRPGYTDALDCDDQVLPDAVYLSVAGGGTPFVGLFHPTFGGWGTLPMFVKCLMDSPGIGYQGLGVNFVARSTDIEGDGDTDEDDVNLLRAAIGTNQPERYDLNFNGTVGPEDLAITINEAKRLDSSGSHYVLAYSSSAWASAICYDNYIPDLGTGGFKMTAPATITNLAAAGEQLSWTAPADDGSNAASGPATRYDIRFSTSANIATNFAAATPLGAPAPGTPGTTQTLSLASLPCGTYYFAMKTLDDVDNASAVSNVVSRTISDATLPGTISNLTGAPGGYMVRLNWTAPGDDGTLGVAAQYEVRYSVGTGAFNWNTATVAAIETPSTPGTAECLVVDQLASTTYYKFAIKTKDNCPNWSVQSNVFSTRTKPASFVVSCAAKATGPEENTPAATAIALEIDRGAERSDNMVALRFSMPSALDGQTYDLSVFDVRGRRTRLLESGVVKAGEHTSRWNLQSMSGARVPAGYYIVRLRAGHTQATRPVVVP